MFTTDGVEELGTQTHSSENGAREVVLIAVSKTALGLDTSFSPPNPFASTLSNEMRAGYFHYGEDVTAQFPRRGDELSVCTEKVQLEHIMWGPEGVHAYYPFNAEEALRLTWDYRNDEWTHETVAFHNYLAEIEREHPELVWENRRQL
jgi:hypothetical protein